MQDLLIYIGGGILSAVVIYLFSIRATRYFLFWQRLYMLLKGVLVLCAIFSLMLGFSLAFGKDMKNNPSQYPLYGWLLMINFLFTLVIAFKQFQRADTYKSIIREEAQMLAADFPKLTAFENRTHILNLKQVKKTDLLYLLFSIASILIFVIGEFIILPISFSD